MGLTEAKPLISTISALFQESTTDKPKNPMSMALQFATPRRRLTGSQAHGALLTEYKGKSPTAENWLDMRPLDDDGPALGRRERDLELEV